LNVCDDLWGWGEGFGLGTLREPDVSVWVGEEVFYLRSLLRGGGEGALFCWALGTRVC